MRRLGVFILILLLLGAFSGAIYYAFEEGSKKGYTLGKEEGFNEGNILGKEEGFEEAFDDTYNKFLESSDVKKIDFSNSILDVDSKKLVKLLVEAVETEADSLSEIFSNILYDVHLELLSEYLTQVEIPDTLLSKFIASYDSIHVAVSDEYLARFSESISISMGVPDRFVLENQSSIIADEFTTTVAQGLCDVIMTIASLVALKERIMFKAIARDVLFTGFCSQLLQEVVPMLQQSFHGAGIFNDMHKLEMIFGEHKRKNIAELATIEDIIPSISVSKIQPAQKWYQSSARIKISGHSRIKAGIDLFHNFAYEVDQNTSTLTVYVEQPKILSIEVNTSTEAVDDGWFNRVEGYIIDQAQQDIEIQARKIALRNGILNDSKRNFEQIFESIFMPVLHLKGIDKVDYKYQNELFFEQERLKG